MFEQKIASQDIVLVLYESLQQVELQFGELDGFIGDQQLPGVQMQFDVAVGEDLFLFTLGASQYRFDA